LGEILHRLLHTTWGVYEAIPVWIFAETDQHFPDEILEAGTA
jgi:hypothetical protein